MDIENTKNSIDLEGPLHYNILLWDCDLSVLYLNFPASCLSLFPSRYFHMYMYSGTLCTRFFFCFQQAINCKSHISSYLMPIDFPLLSGQGLCVCVSCPPSPVTRVETSELSTFKLFHCYTHLCWTSKLMCSTIAFARHCWPLGLFITHDHFNFSVAIGNIYRYLQWVAFSWLASHAEIEN